MEPRSETQKPDADQTLQTAPPEEPTARLIADAEKSAELPAATVGADATQEVSAIDVLEVLAPEDLSSRHVIPLSEVESKPPPLPAPASDELAVFRKLQPSLHPPEPPERMYPASIAPMAIDVAARDEAPISQPPSTAPSWRPPPARRAVGVYALAGALGFCAMVLVGAGIIGVATKSSKSAGRPTLAVKVLAKEAKPMPPAPIADDAKPAEPALVADPETKPEPKPEAKPEPKPVVVAAPAPKPAAKTGTIRFPRNAKDVLVDGNAVTGSSATVSCGKHWVKVGSSFGRTVDVPCGGSTQL